MENELDLRVALRKGAGQNRGLRDGETMQLDDDPVVIESGLSQEIEVDGYSFEVCIYRLEEETTWTLEVIDEEGTSHVWDATFASDFAAAVEALKAIRTAGAERFMYEDSGPTLH